MDPDDLGGLVRVVVEVLVPQEVVDDDDVALLPRVVLALVRLGAQEGVPAPFDDVQPRLAGVAVHGLATARADLEHRHGDAGGLVADRLVEQERGAGAAGCLQQLEVVPAGVQPSRAPRVLVLGEPPDPAGVRVVTVDAGGERGTCREAVDGSRPGVLQGRHPHRLQHRLAGEAQEAGGLRSLVAVPVPRPRGQVQGVARTPLDALAVDLGPAPAGDHEQHRVPGVPVHGGGDARVDLVDQRIHGARRAVAVGAHVDTAPHAPGRVVQLDVGDVYDGVAVLAPLLEERCATLLLHVVVRDSGRGLRCHDTRSC